MPKEGSTGEPIPADPKQLAARLDELRLPPTQRRVARYISAHPDDAALLSGTALAQRIGVSQPTITRVANALGFAGFAHLQESLREQLYRFRANDVGGWQPAIESAISNLEALGALAAEKKPIQDAATLLGGSSPLLVIALRIAAPLGHYVSYQLDRCHEDVRLVDHGDSVAADALATARTAGATSMLCILLPRYPAESIKLLRLGHELGFRIVLIADHSIPPGAEYAEIVLPAPVGAGLVFDTHVAPLLLASLVVDAVADELGRTSQGRLEAVEKLSSQLGTFVD